MLGMAWGWTLSCLARAREPIGTPRTFQAKVKSPDMEGHSKSLTVLMPGGRKDKEIEWEVKSSLVTPLRHGKDFWVSPAPSTAAMLNH